MARSIIAVVVGYIAMFALIFLAFTAEYMLLGADHAFKPASFVASNRWIAIGLAINFVVAVIGGFICAAIAKGARRRWHSRSSSSCWDCCFRFRR